MATPIETNTEELQEILQTVYNLPMAGGGSAEPDLVITATENFGWDSPSTNQDYNLAKIAFDPNAVISMYEKHMAGKDVRAAFRGYLYLNSWSPPIMTAYHSSRVIGYGPEVSDYQGKHYLVVRFQIARFYWFMSNDNGDEILEYRFSISSDMSTANYDTVRMWTITG